MPGIDAGRVVGGKYELVALLGRGSMGEVWTAYHRTLGEQVAIKFIATAGDGEYEDRATAAARFRFEARIAARLSRRTRHVVRVTDFGEDDGIAYLVMELLEGRTLADVLLRRGAMPPADAASVVTQIARALEEAHADGVVHRDLKPANVFLARDEEGGILVKLLDFGIARAVRTVRTAPLFATARGLVFGTPGYMSPEQAFGGKIDARCDLWSLATLAYETLTGELPMPGFNVEELMASLQERRIVPVHERDPSLPAGLAAFFQRAFAPEIEVRFASASELARAFGQALLPPDATAGAAPPPQARTPSSGDTLRGALWTPSPRIAGAWHGSTIVRAVSASAIALAGVLFAVISWRALTPPARAVGAGILSTADGNTPTSVILTPSVAESPSPSSGALPLADLTPGSSEGPEMAPAESDAGTAVRGPELPPPRSRPAANRAAAARAPTGPPAPIDPSSVF
jgi:serine/threonine-protein kinase